MKTETKNKVTLTGVERHLLIDEIIVSKTDTKGRITYANDVFQRIAGYTEDELIGMPHNLIRHPDMPRGAFRFVWDTISSGKEVFAYVVNRCKNGDHYWVFAHITPTFAADGSICGYHSSRRCPRQEAVNIVRKVYFDMREEEAKHSNFREGMKASIELLVNKYIGKDRTYEELIFSL